MEQVKEKQVKKRIRYLLLMNLMKFTHDVNFIFINYKLDFTSLFDIVLRFILNLGKIIDL
ncbi:hypothetical protein MACH09_34920 [Vibrio sp. MACH09]|nr:hypothetical protein MACH09_34920 [Vibrio sp. MACH09]